MAPNRLTICAFPDSFKYPTIKNIPAAAICKTQSTRFTIFPVEPEADCVLSVNACVMPLPLPDGLWCNPSACPCSRRAGRLIAELLQQADERLALRPGQGGGREPFQVGGVIGVGADDQLPAFLRQMNYP